MNDQPNLSQRIKAARDTAVYGAPVSFLFWLIFNLILRGSGGLSMFWTAAGILLFAILGFAFPKTVGSKLRLR
ncbi:MAG: hypothetical protein AAF490_10565 [Chloroflexota bacterium]